MHLTPRMMSTPAVLIASSAKGKRLARPRRQVKCANFGSGVSIQTSPNSASSSTCIQNKVNLVVSQWLGGTEALCSLFMRVAYQNAQIEHTTKDLAAQLARQLVAR